MLTIRNAREEDVAILTEIGLRAWAQAIGPIGGNEEIRDNAITAFSSFVSQSWLTIVVVDENGQAVAWAARENLDEVITDFWVDPDHQRRGIGAMLLQEMEAEIRNHGFDEVRLETHALNSDAVTFFERNGFHINWLSVAYSPKLDQDVQSVGMSKSLLADEGDTYGPGI
ncbi:GNAT family N-acetyltransferase [Rhizobium sp. SSA_523]|uniref:GNAT family N-acetyltransferase n=1 Tax=Rhizobium sp. SSA_523 TaxID=2952477 RepID=UPI0020918987|nr:GNAT family N-acetyltransferase [Rhizobium sp. SSA_523]MCO5730600.1 GNAT family N-acetyltransferase [Rhizobium sp. SSA_523]WKC24568.1 GNAT family N-acetyltransferase [Rhizobium sp. SSA_523]